MNITVTPRPIDWQGVNRDLKGERALIVAVIGQAYYDLTRGCPDAAAYFAGANYRHHLTLLGLPAHWLPAGVTVDPGGAGVQVIAIEEVVHEC